jgi:hypothetical protein
MKSRLLSYIVETATRQYNANLGRLQKDIENENIQAQMDNKESSAKLKRNIDRISAKYPTKTMEYFSDIGEVKRKYKPIKMKRVTSDEKKEMALKVSAKHDLKFNTIWRIATT